MMDADRTKSSRLTLLGLFVLFAAPLAGAFWLYYATDWRPSRTTNHGTLFVPVRTLPALSFADPGARTAVEQLFTGKWTLVVVAAGRCDEACRRSLVYARQRQCKQGEQTYQHQAAGFPALGVDHALRRLRFMYRNRPAARPARLHHCTA